MLQQGRLHRLALITVGKPAMVGAIVDRYRVAHHTGRYRIGQAKVNSAYRPGVAQVVGRKRHSVALKLNRHLLANPLERRGR